MADGLVHCVKKRWMIPNTYPARAEWLVNMDLLSMWKNRCCSATLFCLMSASFNFKIPDWEPDPGRRFWALSDPRLSNPSQDAKEVLLWSRKNMGQYSSPSLSPLISHTQQTSPFRKWSVRDLCFYKEVYSFVIKVVING